MKWLESFSTSDCAININGPHKHQLQVPATESRKQSYSKKAQKVRERVFRVAAESICAACIRSVQQCYICNRSAGKRGPCMRQAASVRVKRAKLV